MNAKQIIHDLQKLNGKLRRGEPIEATRVRRYETPDGPMHTFEHVTLRAEPEGSPPKHEDDH